MKLLIGTTISVLSASFLIVGLCYGQNIAEENWTKGVEYAAQGNFSEAKKEFENALKVDPYYRSARAALKVVEDVIGQKTESKTAVHFFKGVSHSKKKDWAEAIAEYSKVIEINAKYVDAYNERAAAYYFKGQHDQAIADFARAIEIEPSNAWAYFARGSVYHDKGQFDWAIADFTKAIEIDPELAMAYNNRGIAYGEKGQHEQAIADFTKALEIDPGFAMPYGGRGYAFFLKGQFDWAIADFTKAIEIDPELAMAYNNRGIAYFYIKEYEKAWDDVHKVQNLKAQVHPGFLKALRQASGRQE